MADLHNGLKEYTSLLRGVARAVGEQAGAQDFQGIERLGETLTPVLDIWGQPEWSLLRGQIQFARRMNSPAVAARFSGLELVNPTGSNKLVVVEAIFTGATAQDVDFQTDTGGALGATATFRGVATDTRYPQLGESSMCTLVSGDFAAGASLTQYRTNATTPAQPLFTGKFVLAPGTKLWLLGTTVNTALSASLRWSERTLLTNESLP